MTDTLTEALTTIRVLEQSNATLTEAMEHTHRHAARLLHAISPETEPLDKAVHVIDQIDNWIVGIREQLNEADRRAGAAERQLAYTLDTQEKARRWMDEIKAEFGVSPNAPFDEVIEKARRWRDELRERGERED